MQFILRVIIDCLYFIILPRDTRELIKLNCLFKKFNTEQSRGIGINNTKEIKEIINNVEKLKIKYKKDYQQLLLNHLHVCLKFKELYSKNKKQKK